MLTFLTRLFAVIGFVIVALVATVAGLGYYAAEHVRPEPKALILKLALDGNIVEQNQPSPLSLALQQQGTPLFDIVRAIDLAAADPHVKGIVARFGSTQPSLAQAQDIRDVLQHFRASGKFTYAFAASYGDFGTGNDAYYLASAFDNIWLQPVGAVGFEGIALDMPFAKTALAKVGVSADFLQRKEYKSAMDSVTRDDFAPPVKIEMQAMIEDLAAQIAGGVAESRKLDGGKVRELMAAGPYTGEEALKAGLVTHIGYADELEKELDEKAGKDTPFVEVEDYLPSARRDGATATKVALIYGEGMIGDADDGPVQVPGETGMSADQIVKAFDDAAKANDVKAILFRIDSPGGAPDASETIRRALVQAQKKGKPVIVSMGDVAASGGYWIAMSADKIVAEPATLTGSIGVFAGKFSAAGLMQKLGVNWAMLKTSDNAGMWAMTDDFSPVQLARVNALLDDTYAAFVKNVSVARKIPLDKMPDIAEGRVWTGDQAVKIGLVDQLGGYDATLDEVRATLKLGKDAPILLQPFPPPETPLERMEKLLKEAGLESAMLSPLPGEWQKAASALGLLRQAAMKPVELLSPAAALGIVR